MDRTKFTRKVSMEEERNRKNLERIVNDKGGVFPFSVVIPNSSDETRQTWIFKTIESTTWESGILRQQTDAGITLSFTNEQDANKARLLFCSGETEY